MKPETYLAEKGFKTFSMKKTFKRHCERMALRMSLDSKGIYSKEFLDKVFEKMMGSKDLDRRKR